jgi:hypothetical protein
LTIGASWVRAGEITGNLETTHIAAPTEIPLKGIAWNKLSLYELIGLAS